MHIKSRALTLALLAATATATGAQQRPPIRQIGAATAKTAETFTNIAGVRALSSGAVLVNDPAARRVLMFDPQFGKFTVVADSTSATANAYGGRVGSLIAYRGDSTIFVDPSSVSMLIIDPSGKVARVVAIPRAEDAGMIGSGLGNGAFDASGRLIYRTGARMNFRGDSRPRGGSGMPAIPDPPDSAFVVRVDLATRKVDTVGVIRTPKTKLEMKSDDKGNMTISSTINPLPTVDEWAVTADGAVAFIRGKDYHVDFVNPDGTRATASKIPFEWQRMTEEDKVAFIDSLKAARERLGSNAPSPVISGAPPAGGGGGGAPQIQIFMGPGGGPGGPARTTMGGGAPQMNFIPASELPDYKPPFFAGSVRADTEGNLWVRTIPTSGVAGGPVYDVINRKGVLVDRVQIPANRTIAAFGPGGAVYLVNREGATATLEKASIR